MEESIVYAYVVADLLHVGHVLYLENAKALGDKLIVGVLTDEAVMEKKKQPLLPFSERMRLIKSLGCVDVVVPQTDYSPIKNILNIKPNILIESDGHADEDLKETKEVCDINGVKMMKMPYYPFQSSTKIKEKVK